MEKEKGGVFVHYLLIALMGYLLGCSHMAYYLSRLKRVDLRAGGSGNLGASNVTAHDVLKAAAAVWLARMLFPDAAYAEAVAGVCAVLGHIFPFYLKFKGGKGFASYIGMILMLNWKFALIIIGLVVLVTVVTDYIVMGTTLTVVSSPVFFGLTSGRLLVAAILGTASAVILYLHRANYVRIYKGTELGLRSAIRGENRVK